MSTRIVIDQTKLRVRGITVKPGSEFPRPLDWWQCFVPGWLTASSDGENRIVLEPNGHRADGHVYELTPAVYRREMKHARRWLDALLYLDTSDAIVAERGESR